MFIFVWPFVVKIAPSRSQNRPSDFAALGIHWLWVAMLVSVFPSWVEVVLFYFMASCSTGVFLWVLLSLSHAVNPLIEKDQAKNTGTWMRRQLVCIDIARPRVGWTGSTVVSTCTLSTTCSRGCQSTTTARPMRSLLPPLPNTMSRCTSSRGLARLFSTSATCAR